MRLTTTVLLCIFVLGVSRSKANSITGVYDYYDADNFVNYLKSLGVGWFLRHLATLARPTVTISNNCEEGQDEHTCEWKIYTDTLFKDHELNFRLGQTVQDLTMDGRNTLVTNTMPKPNQLLEVQADQNTREMTTTLKRIFTDDAMNIEMKTPRVTATSKFIRRNATP